METKAILNSNVRIKKNENYEELNRIHNEIQERIAAEYEQERKGLRKENELLYEQERIFKNITEKVLFGLKPDTQIKVITQVGKNQSVFHSYIGKIEKPYDGNSCFNMIDDGYNDGKPFTIGLSCLQLIMVV